MSKQIIPQSPKRSLRHLYHNPVIHPCGTDANPIENAYFQNRCRQRPKIRFTATYHRKDIHINQRLHKQRPLDIGEHSYKNPEYHQ